jgi:cysteine-rich repeat protein
VRGRRRRREERQRRDGLPEGLPQLTSRARALIVLVVGRLFQAAGLLLALSFLLFALLASLPGDPVDLLVASNPDLRAEDIARLKKLRGLDQPVPVRWWRWLVGYHEALPPPATRALPPVFLEATALDDGVDGDEARPTTARVKIPVEGRPPGASLRALPPGTLEHVGDDDVLSALLPPGAHRLVVVVRDGVGQEAPWAVDVFVAPPPPDRPAPPAPGAPVVVDESDPQLAGSTEQARPEPRSNREVERDARAKAALPAPIPTIDDGTTPGQRVEVDDDGRVRVVTGPPLVDRERFICGAVCALVGDTDGLGWSWATKRPVAELLFGRAPVCGDFVRDPGEGCDDGNTVDGDGCDASCAVEGASVVERVDVAIAGALVDMGRIGHTLVLTVPSLLLAMLLSLLLGTLAGLRGGRVDDVVKAGAALVSAMPAFFVGLLLVTALAEWLRWLPSGGVFSPGIHEQGAAAVVVDRVRHAVLPVTVLTLFWSGRFVRQVRSAVIAAAAGDFVRTARMKGASEARVVVRHILPNAAVPLVTLMGLSLPSLFGGALLTETVFAWPGIGRLQYDAILQNDSYVAVVVFLISAALVLLGSLFADVAVALIDPRTTRRSS